MKKKTHISKKKATKCLVALRRGKCPICGEPVTSRVVRAHDVQLDQCIELFPGQLYYQNQKGSKHG